VHTLFRCRGTPALSSILPALGLVTALAACDTSGGATRSSDPATALADSLVMEWIDAAGGLDGWRSVRSARYTVTTVWFDSTGAIDRMRPRRVELRKVPAGEQSRIERPEAEGLYVQVFTGDTAWATLNDVPLPADHPAAAESEYVGRDVFYWFGLPYKLFDPGVNRRAVRLDDGGYELQVSFGDTVGAHPGDRYFYYFMDDTPYPEAVHYIEEGKEDRNRLLWRDVTAAAPIAYVARRTYTDDSGQLTKELRIDDVSINPCIPDSLFEPPR
jgi:hypothetical protein